METLEIEKKEHLRRISEYLTPRINGAQPCSIQEQIECEEERVKLSERIAEIDAELAQSALPEQEEVVVQTFDLEAMLEKDGIPLYALVEDATARGIIELKFQSVFTSLSETHTAEIMNLITKHKGEIDGYQERELQLKRQNAELQLKAGTFESENISHLAEIGRLQESLENTTNDLINANNRNAEIEINRQNAVNQLEEEQELHKVTKAELERLKSGHKFTAEELSEQTKQLVDSWKSRLIKVINVRKKSDDFACDIYIAERADNGEIVESKDAYRKGRWDETVTADEAREIREAYEREHVQPPAIEVSEEEIFQEETSEEGALPNHESEDSTEQREAVEVEPESFEEWTRREINALKLAVFRNDLIIQHEQIAS